MKPYVKIYFDAFGYHEGDFVPSEISEDEAVDIHHIVNREDHIENLMAVTRVEHDGFGDKTDYMAYLLKIHQRRLDLAGVPYDPKWFEFYIQKYEALAEKI